MAEEKKIVIEVVINTVTTNDNDGKERPIPGSNNAAKQSNGSEKSMVKQVMKKIIEIFRKMRYNCTVKNSC